MLSQVLEPIKLGVKPHETKWPSGSQALFHAVYLAIHGQKDEHLKSYVHVLVSFVIFLRNLVDGPFHFTTFTFQR